MEIIKLFGDEGLPQYRRSRFIIRPECIHEEVGLEGCVTCEHCGSDMFEGEEFITYSNSGLSYCGTNCGEEHEAELNDPTIQENEDPWR